MLLNILVVVGLSLCVCELLIIRVLLRNHNAVNATLTKAIALQDEYKRRLDKINQVQ